MDWNEETIARLRQLWQEGHSTAEIGRRMGITKNAVVGKAHRLVLSPRPSPIRRGPTDGAPPRRATTRRVTGPTLPSMPRAVTPVSPALEPIPMPRAPVQLRAVPTPRANPRVTTCCWPIGDPGTASFRFCDDGAMANKPYCAQHAALAYVKVRDRREDAA